MSTMVVMVQRILIIGGVVLCALALFGAHVGALTAVREVALGSGLIGAGALL